MTLDDYNRFCRSLPSTTHVVQWEGAHVWKVGGKVFAIARESNDGNSLSVTFKCSPMSYEMLAEMPGCRPAPYLASRGMKWIQRTSAEELDDAGLKDYLRASHTLIVAGLSQRMRRELQLTPSAPAPKSRSAKTIEAAGQHSKSNSKQLKLASARAHPSARKGATS